MLGPAVGDVGGQVSPVAIWVESLAFKSWLPGFPRPKWPRPPVTHVRPVKLTWPGVTHLACNSGHVRRLTWPQGLTWLVTGETITKIMRLVLYKLDLQTF